VLFENEINKRTVRRFTLHIKLVVIIGNFYVQCKLENFTSITCFKNFFRLKNFKRFCTHILGFNLRYTTKFYSIISKFNTVYYIMRDHLKNFLHFTRHLPQKKLLIFDNKKWLKHTNYFSIKFSKHLKVFDKIFL